MKKYAENPYMLGVDTGIKTATEKYARLCSSAPDLLEALKEMEHGWMDFTGKEKAIYLDKAVKKAQSAIDKAEGRKP